MKKQILIYAALLFVGASLARWDSVKAQSIGVTPSSATTLAGCPAPAAGLMNFCQVTNDPSNPVGAYLTTNGAAYFLLQKAGTGGQVASWNNRTGNVMPAVNDYSYAQLSGKPTSFTCTTASQNNTGSSGSGCTFQ